MPLRTQIRGLHTPLISILFHPKWNVKSASLPKGDRLLLLSC
ncbi:hypothetical protein L1F28_11625 [Arthrospira platensis NCB002]|nr:hypothetical protein [Arthrospira platensis]MDF2209392.1 hypothetical protein [Arthrospira platensis NCB002]